MDKTTILLVEDNPDDEALTLHALQRAGYAEGIVVARDGREALDWLFGEGAHQGRDADQTPRLVLLDLKLPKVGGHEVLRRMRADERTRRVPVLVLSCSTEAHDLAEAYDHGANSYIRKAVDFQQFAATMATIARYWLQMNETAPRKVDAR